MHKLLFIIILFILFSCKKDPLENTNKLAGTHSWVGIQTLLEEIGNGPETRIDTEYILNLNKEIKVIDNENIFFYEKMICVYKDKKKLIFVYEDKDPLPAKYYRDTLVYHYNIGKIEYVYRSAYLNRLSIFKLISLD